MLEVHMAFMNGTLHTMIAEQSEKLIAQYPNMSQAYAMALGAAIIGRIAEQENTLITRELRSSDQTVDDLYYWLREDAPCYIVGAIADMAGSRSLLQDMQELDTIMNNLPSVDWSMAAMEKQLTSPEFYAWINNHR